MCKRRWLLILLALLFFKPLSLFAAEPVDLGEVVVEDAKVKEKRPLLDETSAATVLIPEEAKQEALTLPQLLEQSAGLHVKRYGKLDDFSQLSLRGSSAGQVQIYLDDIPLMTAQGSIADLSIVPLSAIDRVEVYRGGSPGSIPESTVGGVVVLNTKVKSDKRESNVYGSVGSFETVKARLNHTQSWGKFSTVLAYEYARSKGDFLYKNDNGTRFNQDDDRVVRRQNNDFALNSLFTKFIVELPLKSTLSFTNVFFEKDEGVPGLGSRESINARLKTWRNVTWVALEKEELFIKNLDGHLDLFFDYWNNQFNDPFGEIGLAAQESNDNTYRFGENLRFGLDIGTHQSFTLFVAHRSEYYCPYDRLANPQSGPKSDRQSINAGLEEEIRLFKDKLILVPSVRVENLFNHGQLPRRSDHQLSAKLGVSIRMMDEFYWKANVYRGFRNPTFAELFGDMGSLQGNSDLRPEKAINFDAGLYYDFPQSSWFDGGHIEATYYRHDVNNLIQYVQTSIFTAKAMNLNKALLQGMEAQAYAKFMKRFKLAASYTYQRAKDISSNPDTHGKYLPGRPKHELYALASWKERWRPWFSTSLYCDLRYMSENYLDTQNLLMVTNRTLLGSGIAVTFIDRLTASFSVQNILNDMISDLIGYPLPGRSYWGSLEVRI